MFRVCRFTILPHGCSEELHTKVNWVDVVQKVWGEGGLGGCSLKKIGGPRSYFVGVAQDSFTPIKRYQNRTYLTHSKSA